MPDPSKPQAFDRYGYAYNNPIRYNDPTGHIVCKEGEYPCKNPVQFEPTDLGSSGNGVVDWIRNLAINIGCGILGGWCEVQNNVLQPTSDGEYFESSVTGLMGMVVPIKAPGGSLSNISRYSNVKGTTKPFLREATANTESSTASRLDELPGYGTGWDGSKTTDTLGILEVPGRGDVYLKSGVEGPAQNPLVPKGLGTGYDAYTVTHVEGHATAVMRLEGIENANLYINQKPCPNCDNNLKYMLPTNSTLTVTFPGEAPILYKGQ